MTTLLPISATERAVVLSALEEAATNARRSFQDLQAMSEHLVDRKLKVRVRGQAERLYERFQALLRLVDKLKSCEASDGAS